jgi:drug/metabolite transporter (DMT)-like permease
MKVYYIAFALCVSFLWGIQPIIHKYLLNKIGYVTIMFISTLIYSGLVITLALTRHKEIYSDWLVMTPMDIGILILLPIFTVFLANILYYNVLKNHESSIISALIYSSPVFTLIIAYLFLKERLDIYGLSGVCAIILGVILIAMNNESNIFTQNRYK